MRSGQWGSFFSVNVYGLREQSRQRSFGKESDELVSLATALSHGHLLPVDPTSAPESVCLCEDGEKRIPD